MSANLKKFALGLAMLATTGIASRAQAVLTPGPGFTLVPLPPYTVSLGGPQNTDGMFNETFAGFDGSGAYSFQLTSLMSIGDTATFTGQFHIDPSSAQWDVAGAGAHRSRLFLEAGVGAPLAVRLPAGAQRDDMNQTPGVTMEYNTLGFNDNTNWDYPLDNVNQVTAIDYVIGDTNTADFDYSNGALPDAQYSGGVATLMTTITRTGASTYGWTSGVKYHYVDDPSTVIAEAQRSGALVLPGSVANTYYTPFNQLGIGDTTGPYMQMIQFSALIFDIAEVVPEPATLGLASMASIGLVAASRRRRAARG